jgi:hypothetical protein
MEPYVLTGEKMGRQLGIEKRIFWLVFFGRPEAPPLAPPPF